MEKTISEKIRLGLFVLIGSLLFIVTVYFIGNKQQMFGNTNHLKAKFSNVNGLLLGNNVRYSGINVGTVREIEMINDSVIIVDMVIEKSIFSHIRKDAMATISSDGLVGNMIINIIPGDGVHPSVQPGDVIGSVGRIRTDDLLSTLSVTNNNAALLTADLLKITKEITQGKGTLGLLVNDTTMSNDLKHTVYYLKKTSKGTAESVENLNKLLVSLNNKDNVVGVLRDTAVANKIKSVVINLEESSNEIDKVVTNLNTTVLNAKEGKGAINYLSNNPNLVKKIDSTMTNINSASFKLNENLEALKHNFLFKGYFKKQKKAAQKKK